ncbi:hypothetical protein P175DRAFT_0516669 [Aspergillus ochraceoroseus IBT 24754]|uniref:Cytochrome P450 monooxygenase n=1 Tax=Aspergillus ochraceoroseus IBT 24754 TaxID=1392256 RepID=A0A2T5LXR7_9EURO|nr:uncharacterized protein P175DRAFT_0516669 [Aspergillus ochraceoroseus IBT 24754]PTU21085.1 hypothetical protein P175DRAFT_0516669 [Aspergillus ochraceoroseus IBT 24754]
MMLATMLKVLGLPEDFFIWPLLLVSVILFGAFCLLKPAAARARLRLDVPTVTLGWFVPEFVNRLLYSVFAPFLIYRGYEKSVLGDYTNILNHSHLPATTVAKKLTPAMQSPDRIVPKIIDELQYAFPIEVPECKGRWVPVTLYDMILKLINRATSRVIVGDELCRSEQWLGTVTSYTHNLGITLILLRPVPTFLRPLVAKFLPSVRYLERTLKWVKDDVFVPMIVARRAAQKDNPEAPKPDDFMQWMMELADNPFDEDPRNIAQGLMVIMALAVLHTSSMLITHALYDLMLHPEYLEPLRAEIQTTLPDGWINGTQAAFATQRYLDSFLRESQRLNPTSEINIQRIAKEPLVFSDGLIIPQGTHICFPTGPLSRDGALLSNPDTFDGFRWCRENLTRTSKTAASLVTINQSNLHFGYGRQACPGRFMGANTAKALLSRLLLEYEMKFEEGRGGRKRPRNIVNGEQIMPNLWARVLIKKREEEEEEE